MIVEVLKKITEFTLQQNFAFNLSRRRPNFLGVFFFVDLMDLVGLFLSFILSAPSWSITWSKLLFFKAKVVTHYNLFNPKVKFKMYLVIWSLPASSKWSVWWQFNPISSIKNVVRRRRLKSNSPIVQFIEIFKDFKKLGTPKCVPRWTFVRVIRIKTLILFLYQ